MSEPRWVKADSSGNEACIELAVIEGKLAVRDSKEPTIVLAFNRPEVDAFLDGLRRGEFDELLRELG